MAAMKSFILKLICLLIHTNLSLAYSLKHCSIDYQENPSADVSLSCVGRKLMTVPDDIPKNAGSIQLKHNLLKKINENDFHGMKMLKILDLEGNQIVYVEDNSFSCLVLLKTLCMRDNKLANLTSNMFQGLSNLTELDLEFNEIQFIHMSAFQFLISLKTLNLGNNKLQQIDDILPILQLPQIQRFSLGCNEMSSFQSKDLPLNLSSSLKELVLYGYNLKNLSISTPVFPYLNRIELSGSEIHWDIPEKTLLRNITQLYLGGSVLTFEGVQKVLQSLGSLRHLILSPSENWFEKGLLSIVCKIPTLQKLDLFDNILRKLTFTLTHCSQLKELDLSDTWINELSTVQRMKHLRLLNVSHNQITKVPKGIRDLSSLEILNMNYNFISELSCEDFANTTHLTELLLYGNRIFYLESCVVDHLTELKLLDLGENQLQNWGDSFKFALHKLEILDISPNPIPYLETEDFQGLESLKHLNVASFFIARAKHRTFRRSNNLEAVFVSHRLEYEPNFRGLQHLEYLTVNLYCGSNLKIPHVISDESFFFFRSLKHFTVTCTGGPQTIYSEVPLKMLKAMKHLESFKAVNVYKEAPGRGTFYFALQLKNLTITNTDLKDLDPEMFLTIPKLQTLDLSESSLNSLDFLLQANLTALRYLKLTDNKISVINETVFDSLPSLVYLDLENNPFTCDCSNAGFIKWVKNNKQTQVVNAHEYKCSFPGNKAGNVLLDFDIQPCWNDGSFFFFISSTCLVFLTLLTSFIYHFLRWHLVYTFHLFLAFVYDTKNRGKEDHHQFDAFVSYNVHDEDWVYREMLPVLEGEQGWRLCLHHRDFQPGKPIIENITDAIYGSRKTICVISHHYLQSEWCSREIQMASFRLFDEQKDVLILLFLEEIPPHHLSPYYHMRKLIKKRTYLSWPQAAQHPGLFWQNVHRALQTGDSQTEERHLLTGPMGCGEQ